jgi:hypothetical protein
MPKRVPFTPLPQPVSESWWATPKAQASRAEFDAAQAKRQTEMAPTSVATYGPTQTHGRKKPESIF